MIETKYIDKKVFKTLSIAIQESGFSLKVAGLYWFWEAAVI